MTDTLFPVEFTVRGERYELTVLDDELMLDPTLLIFRGKESEAVITAHLDPFARCAEHGHIVVRRGDTE